MMDDFESYVRGLRDRVFGQVSTEGNWQACRAGWLRPECVRWLEQKAGKEPTR